MDAWEVSDVQSGRAYTEFVRAPDLSAGVYRLPAGGTDPQQPHSEDELYYVVSGRGAIIVGDEQRPVGPGTVVFVPAQVPHRFVDITADLVILVVFGPAEYTRRETP
jgi:mannose-6-phosphate isomerase-like protein (cupin superfamily)